MLNETIHRYLLFFRLKCYMVLKNMLDNLYLYQYIMYQRDNQKVYYVLCQLNNY